MSFKKVSGSKVKSKPQAAVGEVQRREAEEQGKVKDVQGKLQGKVGKMSNSHIFLHLMVPVDLSPKELNVQFEKCINRFVSKYGGRLQELRVDEIVVKVGVGTAAAGRKETLRFTASSMTGEYLKPVGLIERHDPVTGRPVQWLDIESGTERELLSVPQRQMQRRRSMARRAGSTYAPEFLGMMKVALIEKWRSVQTSSRRAGGVETPATLFSATELMMGSDGNIV